MEPHDVFISYSSKDKLTADKICNFLEANGVRCWITPRDVLPGANWGESIIDAIYDTRAMLLVFSSNSNISEHIKREVERAVNRGKVIIPFRIEDVMPCKSLEYFISAQHWLDAYTPPLEKHLLHLVKTIKMLLSKIGEEPEMVKPAPHLEPPQPEVQAAPPESHEIPPSQEETFTPPPRVAPRMERTETAPATSASALLEMIKGKVGRILIPIAAVAVLVVVLFWWRAQQPSEPVAVSPSEVTAGPQAPSTPETSPAQDLVNKADAAKDASEKLGYYNKALELDAQHIGALTKRAGLYYSQGEYDKALQDYDKIISLKSDNAEIFNARGNVHLAKGEYDLALDDFNKAISLDANSVNSYVNRGNTHYFKKDYDQAIKDFSAALSLKPDCVIAYNNRGKVCATKGESKSALEDYNKAISMDSAYGKAYKNRALIYEEQGQIDEAISDYDKAISLNTDLAESYFHRGKLYKQKGEEKKAAEDFDKAKALDPNLKF
jgi:tetratricopeptide (TPR) repeat protein